MVNILDPEVGHLGIEPLLSATYLLTWASYQTLVGFFVSFYRGAKWENISAFTKKWGIFPVCLTVPRATWYVGHHFQGVKQGLSKERAFYAPFLLAPFWFATLPELPCPLILGDAVPQNAVKMSTKVSHLVMIFIKTMAWKTSSDYPEPID